MSSPPRAPIAAVACVALAALLAFIGVTAVVVAFVGEDLALLPVGAGAVAGAVLLWALGQICADVARIARRP